MDPHLYSLPDSHPIAIRAVLNLAVVTCGISESLKTRLVRETANNAARKRAEHKRHREVEEEGAEEEEGQGDTTSKKKRPAPVLV